MRRWIRNSAMRIAFLLGLIFGLMLASYFHGYNVGVVNTEKVMGPVLYKCVEILGARLEHKK